TLKGGPNTALPYEQDGTAISIYTDAINQLSETQNGVQFSQIVLEPLGVEASSVPNLHMTLLDSIDTFQITFPTISSSEEAIQLHRIYLWLKCGTDADTFHHLLYILEQSVSNTMD